MNPLIELNRIPADRIAKMERLRNHNTVPPPLLILKWNLLPLLIFAILALGIMWLGRW